MATKPMIHTVKVSGDEAECSCGWHYRGDYPEKAVERHHRINRLAGDE